MFLKYMSVKNTLFAVLGLILLVFVSFGFFATTDRAASWLNTKAADYTVADGNL